MVGLDIIPIAFIFICGEVSNYVYAFSKFGLHVRSVTIWV